MSLHSHNDEADTLISVSSSKVTQLNRGQVAIVVIESLYKERLSAIT